MAVVTDVTITPSDISKMRFEAEATAVFSDGTQGKVLTWFDDELTFTEADFIGKNQDQINDLFLQRDRAYLQS